MLNSEDLELYDGEVIVYYGGITRDGYHEISTVLENFQGQRHKVCLILITNGGDPDAAYRIARAMNHHFERIEILIPDVCKSAGTLLCIGAHKLIFGDRGELGPLDIQISKPDEMFESMSGLDIIQALKALENQIAEAFNRYLVDVRTGSGLRTKIAADIATKLADGLVSPIASKIDPVTVGEHQRAMRIAFDYGQRLSDLTGSLKPNSLLQLVSGYPSHSFVIDRKEATSLFKKVESPDDKTIKLYEWARFGFLTQLPYPRRPIICNLREEVLREEQERVGRGGEVLYETETFNESGSSEDCQGTDGSSEQ